jgi:hypothetical protein
MVLSIGVLLLSRKTVPVQLSQAMMDRRKESAAVTDSFRLGGTVEHASRLARGDRGGSLMKARRNIITAGVISGGLILGITACGSTPSSSAASQNTPAAAAASSAAAAGGGGSSVTDTNPADSAACNGLVSPASALIADNGDDPGGLDLDAVGTALQGPTDGGTDSDPQGNSDMSLSLATAFNALGDDTTGGGTTSMTTASVTADAQAVVSGCNSAGVLIPSGFASAVAADAMTNSAQ